MATLFKVATLFRVFLANREVDHHIDAEDCLQIAEQP